MTVKDLGPSGDSLKTKCRHCYHMIEYTPNDIHNRKSHDYTGDYDVVYYISCANCNKEISVKRVY